MADCPFCGEPASIGSINEDYLLCSKHGKLPGLLLLLASGVPRYEFIAEWRASEARREIQLMASDAIRQITSRLDLYAAVISYQAHQHG